MKKLLMVIPFVILLCFTFGCPQGEKVAEEPVVDAAEKEAEPTITIDNAISADGVSIAYEVRGEGEPALVFVHGWSSNRNTWEAELAHFSQKYKVVAIDLAGFGASGNNREKWTMGAFGEDVAAVIKQIGLDDAVLIGHSMGGPVILEAAKRIPESITGLVLVDVLQNIETVYSEERISNLDRAYMDRVKEPTFWKIQGYFVRNKVELYKRWYSLVKDVSKVGWSESLKNLFRWCNEECTKSLQRIQAPITSINSDRSPTNVEAFKKYVPSFKVKIITGVGHFVFWEAPEEFNRLLEETIQEFVQKAKLPAHSHDKTVSLDFTDT